MPVKDWLLLHVAPCDSYAILGPDRQDGRASVQNFSDSPGKPIPSKPLNEICRILNISRATLYRYVNTGVGNLTKP